MTQSQSSSLSFKKLIIFGIVIFAAAVGGIYFGTASKSWFDNEPTEEPDVFTGLGLTPQNRFPDVTLTNERYETVSSRSLLHPSGTVVLFLDNGCPPCRDMVTQWQAVVDEEIISPEQIFGVTFNDIGNLTDFKHSYQLTFALYGDTAWSFMNNYGVDAYPLAVIIDKAGVIQAYNYNVNEKIDKEKLKEWLEG